MVSMGWVASQRGIRVNAAGAEGATSQRDIFIERELLSELAKLAVFQLSEGWHV